MVVALTEPKWQRFVPFKQHAIDKGLLSWLLEPNSLTQRLRNRASHFEVRVLSQTWQVPFKSEAVALGLGARQMALVREVELRGNDSPWVFARTIMPIHTLSGREKVLANLGNRPLGHYLFQNTHATRGPFEIANIQPKHYHYHRATSNLTLAQGDLMARRSLFYLRNKPLLVSEVFTHCFIEQCV